MSSIIPTMPWVNSPEILNSPANHTLGECFMALRQGRPAKAQELLECLAFAVERYSEDSIVSILEKVVQAERDKRGLAPDSPLPDVVDPNELYANPQAEFGSELDCRPKS